MKATVSITVSGGPRAPQGPSKDGLGPPQEPRVRPRANPHSWAARDALGERLGRSLPLCARPTGAERHAHVLVQLRRLAELRDERRKCLGAAVRGAPG